MNNINHEKIFNLLIGYNEKIGNKNPTIFISNLNKWNKVPFAYHIYDIRNTLNKFKILKKLIKNKTKKIQKYENILFLYFEDKNNKIYINKNNLKKFYLEEYIKFKIGKKIKLLKKSDQIYSKMYNKYINHKKKEFEQNFIKKNPLSKYKNISKKIVTKYNINKYFINVKSEKYEPGGELLKDDELFFNLSFYQVNLIKIDLKKTYRKYGLLIPKNIKKEFLNKVKKYY